MDWNPAVEGVLRGGMIRDGNERGCIASNSNCYLNCFIFSGKIYHYPAASDSKDGVAAMRRTRSV